MSTTNNQLELPPLEKAAQIGEDITLQVFFAKMAEHGMRPQTEEQAASMVRTATMALQLQQHPAVKQASAANDPILLAEQKLAELAGNYGFRKAAADEEAILNQFATMQAANPDVYKAMLSLSQSEAAAA